MLRKRILLKFCIGLNKRYLGYSKLTATCSICFQDSPSYEPTPIPPYTLDFACINFSQTIGDLDQFLHG